MGIFMVKRFASQQSGIEVKYPRCVYHDEILDRYYIAAIESLFAHPNLLSKYLYEYLIP